MGTGKSGIQANVHFPVYSGASKEQADWFNELQRISSSAGDAVRNLLANGEVDVTSLLSQVNVPTLVMHARHDARVSFEAGGPKAPGRPAGPLRPPWSHKPNLRG